MYNGPVRWDACVARKLEPVSIVKGVTSYDGTSVRGPGSGDAVAQNKAGAATIQLVRSIVRSVHCVLSWAAVAGHRSMCVRMLTFDGEFTGLVF